MPEHHQSGISLIELMIALVLSSLLMLGVMRMFLDNTRSSASDSALVQIQDSARIAMEMIKRDVRMAGYRGSDTSANTEVTTGSLIDFDNQSVIGVEGTGDPTNNNALTRLESSDTLAILRAEEMFFSNDILDPNSSLGPVRVTAADQTGLITLNKKLCYSSDDVLMVSDGRQLAVFKPSTNAHECKADPTETFTSEFLIAIGQGNSPISLKDYVIPPECAADEQRCPELYNIGSTTGLIYDIRQTGRVGSDGQPIFALFRDDEEMVEGVENLQVLYGIQDGSKIRYTMGCDQNTFDNGNCNPGMTTHIRISLVIAASNNVIEGNQQLRFDILNLNNNKTLVSNDRRLRRVFTTTIQLRNQG
ncbi:PilW family protein [Endozoicomonas ascidiicola]|nr:PilW family protein [Endozoicomonas ascidiicola]